MFPSETDIGRKIHLERRGQGEEPDHIQACLLAYLYAMDLVDDAKPVDKAAAKSA